MFKTIQIKLFAVAFSILAINVKAKMDSEIKGHRNQFDPDLTQHLTDYDIKLALSDLSLEDLKSLQAFIDSADYNDLNYRENRLANEKYHSYDLDRQEFGNTNDNPDEDDYSFEPKNTENDFVNYLKRQRYFEEIPQENQRAKRNDEKINTHDEYINQLENSFPQSEQLNYNNFEGGKPHIRVKRT